MKVEKSTNVSSDVKSTLGNVAKTTGSPPAVASRATLAQSTFSGQTKISGQGLMISRLFGNTNTIPPVQTQLTKEASGMNAVNFLTQGDRNMLSDLYAQAQDQGTDLRYVDDLARDLGKYRKFGSESGNLNIGNTYDKAGHKQTIEFTQKDAATALRILNSGNVSRSVLDPGFLKYELDSGYSFSHKANFEYLESIVNNFGQNKTTAHQSQATKFSTYVSQGQNNFIVNTASEVTFKADEPDVINKDGVFYVTETGKKHGFRLEDKDVVQDNGFPLIVSQPKTLTRLLDHVFKILIIL
ncbi:hypothetical protein [Serratia symbiotica]|uniref:hypothetical protein n=1 Tax=Serratia symbiotica TaxID=138074 RepID=UPI00135F349C|nr:hypothetical protein [Serratia symbiotica]MBQ0956069.1 hypothetical protein [Serratia symbiotica]